MKIYSAIYEDYAHVNILFPQATTEVVTKPEELNEEGILIIHGGADISPTIYNQKPSYLRKEFLFMEFVEVLN